MKRYQARILAFTLILASISLAASWELYFDDKLNTTTVYQTQKELPKGHLVTSTDLTAIKIKYYAVPEKAVKEIKNVINKETLYPLSKGSIAVIDFFDSPDIIPNSDQMIVPVPNDWIYSLPGSLRRKDKVNIYNFCPDPVIPKNASIRPLLVDITVAYAKDSANQEVKASNNKLQRIDATGNIAQLELILTENQFKLLETKALDGYKFIFTYR